MRRKDNQLLTGHSKQANSGSKPHPQNPDANNFGAASLEVETQQEPEGRQGTRRAVRFFLPRKATRQP